MKYIVLKPLQLPTGTLVKLTEAQAERRAGRVAHVKGKQYECLVPVWVKANEIIDLDEPAKHLTASLQPQSGKPAAPEKVVVAEADKISAADAALEMAAVETAAVSGEFDLNAAGNAAG